MPDTIESNTRMRWLIPEVAISGLMLVLLVLCALTYNRYGFTTDELNGLVRANNIYDFFASGGLDDTKLLEIRSENFYGAMADVLALWIQRLFPPVGLDSRHLVSGLFGIIGIYYTYRLGEHVGGRWVGVAAAGFLTLTPMWLGYSFINVKDIPFGTALLAASYYGVKVMGEAKRPGWSTLVGLAIWCGALGTSKLTGILLLGFCVLVLLAFWLLQHGWLPLKTLAQRALLCAGIGFAGIAIFSIAFWPQLYLYSPIQTFKAVLQFLNYDPWRGNVLLDGQFFDQDHVPQLYLVTYLLITMPLLPMALYVVGIPLALLNKRYAMLGVLLLPSAFLGIQMITEAQVYNGYRQFLFTIPFLCIGAGYGLVALGNLGGRMAARIGALAMFVIFAGWSTFTMASLFPYQYSAYNALVGGTAGAEDKYYIDVWRSAQREALQLIEDQLPEGNQRVRVRACGSALNFQPFPRLAAVRNPNEMVDFVIRMPRCSLTNPDGFEVVGEIRRGGVLFAAVLRPKGAS